MGKGSQWTEARRRELPLMGVRFFLAAALCAARIGGGEAPFALGCVAAAGPGAGGIAALLGCGMGLALFLDFASGLIQLGSAILIAAAMTALQGTKLSEKRGFAPVCSGGMYLAVKGIWVLQSADPAAGLPLCLLTAALCALSAWGYVPLLRGRQPEEEGLRFLGLTLLAALGAAEPAGLSLGGIGVMTLAVLTAWRQGTAKALETGLLGGFLLDCCAGAGLRHAAACALVGLLAGEAAKGRWRRLAPALAAGLSGAILLLLTPGAEGQALLAEAALGGLLFLALPGKLFGGKRLAEEAPAPSALTEGMRQRLRSAAEAFRDLYESLGRTPVRDLEENPAILFDRAAEKVCRDCALCSLCWRKEYVGTFNAMNDAAPFLLERGRALAKDFPSYFADRCIHLTDYLSAVNGELSAYLLRRQYRLRLEESRREARGQYAQMGELLSAAAADLTAEQPVSGRAGPECRVGAVLRPKEGEKVCGDSLESFAAQGQLCLLLSDGSGSGESARRESALTSRLLRQFLEAGIQPEAALKTLNSALALRGEETGSFATIDLLTLRRETGEAVFYKYGAAPSYLKRLGSVRRITGTALPAGLREAPAPPDVTRLRLEGGSFAVLISDGVADAGSDEWLQDFLAGWSGEDPQALAGAILAECRKRGALRDDCAVQAVYFPEGEVRRA